jgi:tRNA acetyltransferase TAN1
MAPGGEGKPNTAAAAAGGAKGGGRKRKFLPHGKPVRKGAYPLRPGVQGFFITCDGGRERQATREALSLLDSVSCSPVFRFSVRVIGRRVVWPFLAMHAR